MQDAILSIPEEQEMKLRAEDKEWLSEEITTQIEAKIDEFKHGWQRLAHFAKAWIPLGAALGVLIALLGLAGAGWNYAFTRVDKQARFEEKTAARLDAIEKRLGGIENNLKILPAQFVVSKLTPLPPKELKQHKQELLQAKNSLATVPKETASLWPAGFQVITLLSQAQFQAKLEEIMSQPEGGFDNVRSNAPGIVGPVQNQRVVLKNSVEGFTFINSVVRFDPSVPSSQRYFHKLRVYLPAIRKSRTGSSKNRRNVARVRFVPRRRYRVLSVG